MFFSKCGFLIKGESRIGKLGVETNGSVWENIVGMNTQLLYEYTVIRFSPTVFT